VVTALPDNVFAIQGELGTDTDADTFVKGVCESFEYSFQAPFELGKMGQHWISISIGAAHSNNVENATSVDLLNATWHALRTARKENEICLYDQTLKQAASRRLQLEQDIRAGLSQGHFVPYFQPIVCGENGDVLGYEALARFIHPSMGMVSPGEFIPVAEETGLMLELGEQILIKSLEMMDKVVRQINAPDSLYVSVNIAPAQLAQAGLVDLVLESLAASGLKPENLRLEVTETALVENMETAFEQLKQLQSQGIKISLDDFGTGYSSLSYLRKLPIDLLKIDRSFVTRLYDNESKMAIVKTVISLAGLLGLDVIAEGVESNEEAQSLISLGAGKLQGFYYSKPVPIDEIIEKLKDTQHAEDQNGI
jgi:EAL domain-containing protein (putative c-di-GMP-specific phosphodiesterase class I)